MSLFSDAAEIFRPKRRLTRAQRRGRLRLIGCSTAPFRQRLRESSTGAFWHYESRRLWVCDLAARLGRMPKSRHFGAIVLAYSRIAR